MKTSTPTGPLKLKVLSHQYTDHIERIVNDWIVRQGGGVSIVDTKVTATKHIVYVLIWYYNVSVTDAPPGEGSVL